MLPNEQGSIRLGRVLGIELFLHWSWLIVAVWQIQNRPRAYSSPAWSVAEYAALFGIVLLHEFGHSLACCQVGGRADRIVLWPLGGVAYVAPPSRPGAVLWSIAAGPLVNLVLAPVLFGLAAGAGRSGLGVAQPDLVRFLEMLAWINAGLLLFNLLPVYPLDGGQILRALLWYPLGPVRSLFYASLTGLLGVVALGGLALLNGSIWLGILAFFVGNQALRSFRAAREIAARERSWRAGVGGSRD